METTIYRTGQMSLPTHSADLLELWDEFDSQRPEGHASRREALFSAPEIYSGHRWLHNAFLTERYMNRPFLFNEITVESDNVRVYDVLHFELGVNQPNRNERIKAINDYWNTSMTLTEWRDATTNSYGSWEILLPVNEVISSRPLTYSEIRELYVSEGLDAVSVNQLDLIFRPRLESALLLNT